MLALVTESPSVILDDSVELSIIMPVFNEKATIQQAIGRVLAVHLPVEIIELIIVEDGSTDGSREELANGEWPDEVRVVFHDSNRGKGSAVRTGLAAARGTYSVVADADLELDPGDLVHLLEPLKRGEAAVFGARVFPKTSRRELRYWLGNKGVTLVANILFRASLSDLMTCYKAMPTTLFRALPLQENGFGIEAEITARLLQRRVHIHEVPIAYTPRQRHAGKKLTMLDGFRVLRTLARCRFNRGKRPLPAIPQPGIPSE